MSNNLDRCLFRGKRVDCGEWAYGYYYKLSDDRHYIMLACPIVWNGIPIEELMRQHAKMVIPETVGQFTGLTDKDGNEIFEGDIVKQEYEACAYSNDERIGYHIGVVKILPSMGTVMHNPFSYDDLSGDYWQTKRNVPVRKYRCKVIGNKFDNKEYLHS